MPQPKGKTGNPNGRPKGVPNKSTAEMRDFIQAFIEHNAETMQMEFDKLDAPDKFRVLEKLMPYVLPRHNSITVNSPEIVGRNLPDWMTEGD